MGEGIDNITTMVDLDYTISSTEEHRQSGDDYETKSMLYLLEFHKDHNDMFYFVIDFFNDVSGVDEQCSQIWDLQSKADKDEGAKGIGRKLITLFKNYISSLNPFVKSYILFIGGVGSRVRVDKSKNVFTIDNITDDSKEAIIEGLIEEGQSASYIRNKSTLNKTTINSFLSNVVIVVNDKEPEEYIKKILNHYSPNLILDDSRLKLIFEEIRNKQHSKKYIPIKGVIVNQIADFKKFDRSLSENELRLLIVQRAITKSNKFEVSDSFPDSFPQELKGTNKIERKQILMDCHSDMIKSIFQNDKDSFWDLFNNIIQLVKDKENEEEDVRVIYSKLDEENKKNPSFNELSLIYFISLIKDCF